MPEICRFFGIVIKMYYADHPPPHFHAKYGDEEAMVDIRSLAVVGGRLSPRALGLVVEWATQHQEELLRLWQMASIGQPIHPLEPLR